MTCVCVFKVSVRVTTYCVTRGDKYLSECELYL